MDNNTIGLILTAIATISAVISCINSIKKKKKSKKLIFKEKSYTEGITSSSAQFFADKKNLFITTNTVTVINKGSEEITSEDLFNDDDISTPIYLLFPTNYYIRHCEILKRDGGAIDINLSRNVNEKNKAELTWTKLKEKKGFTIKLETEYYENGQSENHAFPCSIKLPSDKISFKITHVKQKRERWDGYLLYHICITLLIIAISSVATLFFFLPNNKALPVNCTIQTIQVDNYEITTNSYHGTLYSEKKFVYNDSITINPTTIFLQDTTIIRLSIDREGQCPTCVNDSNDRGRFRYWLFITIGLFIIISIISYFLYVDESNYQIRD